MKNLKNLVLSSAFVFAVVGAFAFQEVENSNVQIDRWEGEPGDCTKVENPVCTGNGELCTNEFTDPGCSVQARMP